jgi:hypothetical protein
MHFSGENVLITLLVGVIVGLLPSTVIGNWSTVAWRDLVRLHACSDFARLL